ncbi:MAG: type 4a pilus biogenesis protein PilO [bacterium]|nr:type 4a pilus biogenesis protein PilO [bacterium]
MNLSDLFSLEEHENLIEYFRKYQKYLYAIIIIVISIQMFFSIIKPKFSLMSTEKHKLSQFKVILASKKNTAQKKEDIEAKLKRIKSDLLKRQGMLFNESDFNNFYVKKLATLAENTGNEVHKISLSKYKTSKKNIETQNLQISLTGDFFGIIALYSVLEKYSKIIKIKDFNMSSISAKPVRLRCNLTLEVYMIK